MEETTMCSEGKKGQEQERMSKDFECSPGNFQEMMEMMKRCCPGENSFTDCKTMMEAMKMCCGQTAEKAESGCQES
jgi:hypothetical protein